VSGVNDLITIAAAMKRIRKARGFVEDFANATRTLHAPSNKIVWPEFERAYMNQRKGKATARRSRHQQPTATDQELHPLVKC
jgi:hypothetical protein